MKKLGPGYNEEGWKGEFKCFGGSMNPGCGAPLEVTKADLYLVEVGSIRMTEVVCYTCPCGVESIVSEEMRFIGLPTKEEWRAKQTPTSS